MIDEEVSRSKFLSLKGVLHERARRLWAATEAKALGRGGVKAVLRATGLSSTTLNRGRRDLASGESMNDGRIRRLGAGRKSLKVLEPGLDLALEELVEPVTRGDPESPLRWTGKSTRRLACELKRAGYRVSHTLVGQLLHASGYSLQANAKNLEGAHHPDRNAQFEHINREAARQIRRQRPAISVDTKKKELIGDFKNAGKTWRPKGCPQEVRVHDFVDKKLGKAIPYGVYDMTRNTGWVSVGITHNTASFAVATIRRWWLRMGRRVYPNARSLLITAGSGGSNGSRRRLWEWELQQLADEIGLTLRVCHLPPGTSKWNKIEHRLFSFISQNWRGMPLLTHAAIVSLIGSTRTDSGLKVRCELDRRHYRPKIKVTDDQMKAIYLIPDAFHGEWNYAIKPRRK